MKRVKPTQIPPKKDAQVIPLNGVPSGKHSQWILAEKTHHDLRGYFLVVKDEKGQILDSSHEPEMLLEGQIRLHELVKISKGTWLVRVEFTAEQSLVKIGFRYGPHRVDNFANFYHQSNEIDVMASRVYTTKFKVRADGKEVLRVYVELKDMKGYTVYSHHDHSIIVHADRKHVKIAGPFSTSSGPYFQVTSTKPGEISYEVSVDGHSIGKKQFVSFVSNLSRVPAGSGEDCLQYMAKLGEVKAATPELTPEEAYREMGEMFVRRFEEKGDASPEALDRAIASVSDQRCLHQTWDESKEDLGRALRSAQRRLMR